LKLWGGQLWSDGYAAALQVRLPAQKSKNISIGIEISGCLQRNRLCQNSSDTHLTR